MKPEFYLDVVNPEAKKQKYLLILNIKEHRGRHDFFYPVFWPCDNLSEGKRAAKSWCKQERIEVLKIHELRTEEIIHSNGKAVRKKQ